VNPFHPIDEELEAMYFERARVVAMAVFDAIAGAKSRPLLMSVPEWLLKNPGRLRDLHGRKLLWVPDNQELPMIEVEITTEFMEHALSAGWEDPSLAHRIASIGVASEREGADSFAVNIEQLFVRP
jgi:hypothetical protein